MGIGGVAGYAVASTFGSVIFNDYIGRTPLDFIIDVVVGAVNIVLDLIVEILPRLLELVIQVIVAIVTAIVEIIVDLVGGLIMGIFDIVAVPLGWIEDAADSVVGLFTNGAGSEDTIEMVDYPPAGMDWDSAAERAAYVPMGLARIISNYTVIGLNWQDIMRSSTLDEFLRLNDGYGGNVLFDCTIFISRSPLPQKASGEIISGNVLNEYITLALSEYWEQAQL
jgi:hypothetical protein